MVTLKKINNFLKFKTMFIKATHNHFEDDSSTHFVYSIEETANIFRLEEKEFIDLMNQLGFLDSEGHPTILGYEIGIFSQSYKDEKTNKYQSKFTWDALIVIKNEIQILTERQM